MPIQPVFRVVLLHTEPAVQDLCPGTVRTLFSKALLTKSKSGVL